MPRLLQATIRNAITWGAAWAVAGGSLLAMAALIAPDAGQTSIPARITTAAIAAAVWGVRFGLAGAVAGTLFAAVVRLRYRGRRLADISPLRFALLGAVAGGVGVPLYLQTMNVLFGGGAIAWRLVLDDAPLSALLGAVAAAGSILLARRGAGNTRHPVLATSAHHAGLGAGWGSGGVDARAISDGTRVAIPSDHHSHSRQR